MVVLHGHGGSGKLSPYGVFDKAAAPIFATTYFSVTLEKILHEPRSDSQQTSTTQETPHADLSTLARFWFLPSLLPCIHSLPCI